MLKNCKGCVRLTSSVGFGQIHFQLKTLLQAGSGQTLCGGWLEWDLTSEGVGGNG